MLPLVYTASSSSHFEEQLVLVLDTIARWPSHGLEHTRARVCILQLREVSAPVLHRLQNMHTALHPQ